MDRIMFTASTTGSDRAEIEAELDAEARRFFGGDRFVRRSLTVDCSPAARRCDGTVTEWSYMATADYSNVLP